MNSESQASSPNKDRVLEDLKHQNEKMHLAKLITLITIKIEEKFPTIAKAFLYFDADDQRQINRTKFAKGLDGLRVKLNYDDIEKVFKYLDKDKDNCLDFREFTQLLHEKRLLVEST